VDHMTTSTALSTDRLALSTCPARQ
jgi:hypothetical protein